MRKNERAITLVALVVTIIILLILAGITISQLTGSGLFENAKLAEQKAKNAQEEEDGKLQEYENTINKSLKNEYVTIEFNANGGTGTMKSISIYKDTETQLSNNIFTKDGYCFDKWNTKADGTGIDYITVITVSEDTTLYAQWVKIDSITSDTIEENVDKTNSYKIANASQLVAFAEKVNNGDNYSGKYVELTNDIDLKDVSWVAIGNSSTTKFMGCFNGNNYTISNLVTASKGIFGYIENAIIENLNVSNINITSTSAQSGIVLYGYSSKIYNCNVSGNITVNTYAAKIAGVVGYADNCYILACSSNCVLNNYDYSTANTSGSDAIGQIVAEAIKDTVILKCSSQGEVNLKNGCGQNKYYGGIVGYLSSSTISKCYNQSNIKCYASNWNQSSNIGGIIGCSTNNSKINNCYNSGNIIYEGGKNALAGGIIGKSFSVAEFYSCYNVGSISSYFTAYGGIAGYAKSEDQYNIIDNCYYFNTIAKGVYGYDDVPEKVNSFSNSETELNELHNKLNNGQKPIVWIPDTNSGNSGFPMLGWQKY